VAMNSRNSKVHLKEERSIINPYETCGSHVELEQSHVIHI
jgi:hypothetical protein